MIRTAKPTLKFLKRGAYKGEREREREQGCVREQRESRVSEETKQQKQERERERTRGIKIPQEQREENATAECETKFRGSIFNFLIYYFISVYRLPLNVLLLLFALKGKIIIQ